MKLRQILATTLVAASAFIASATDEESSYLPNFHGIIRPRFEMETESGDARFQMRNARVSLDGKVGPAIDYFMQVDLCDQGSMKALDFWVRLQLAKGLKFQAGQFRMPFGVDTFRGPATYYFANRSFIGKQICNYRAVGFKMTYKFSQMPLTLEAGVFNPYTIGNHNVWSEEMSYAFKASYPVGNLTFTTGVMSIYPETIRTNLIDACVAWSYDRWHVEAEYMHEHYTNNTHKPCNGYNAFVNYAFPINAGIFNRMSLQGRFDTMTGHSTAKVNDYGELITNDDARKRITIGATITHFRAEKLFLDMRLNYEKYFYDDNISAPIGQDDKIVAEMVLRF